MAVFDTMRHIRPDVSTICVGLAASMGAFLLASGHKVATLLNACWLHLLQFHTRLTQCADWLTMPWWSAVLQGWMKGQGIFWGCAEIDVMRLSGISELCAGQALLAAQFAHYDPSAAGWSSGPGCG